MKSQQTPKRRRLSSLSILATCVLTAGLATAQAEKPAGSSVNNASAAAAARSASVGAAPAGSAAAAKPPVAKKTEASKVTTKTAAAGTQAGETQVVKTSLTPDAEGKKTASADAKKANTPESKKAAEAKKKAAELAAKVEAEAKARAGAATDAEADAGTKVNETDDDGTAAAASSEVIDVPVGPLVVPPPPPPPVTVAEPSASTPTAPAPVAPPPPSLGVTYLNRAVFLIATDGTKVAGERRKRLSDALKRAIEAEEKATPDSPNVEIVLQPPDNMELRVRGHIVGVLTDKDAIAARQPDLASYAKALDEGLELFVADQRRKVALQGIAVRIAIAMVVSIIGLFFLRLAQALFARADEYIDEHSASIRPFKVLGVPVLGVEGLNAVITFVVAIGRIATLVGIAVVAAAIALAQFELTRPWIAVAATWSTARLFSGFEEAVLVLPRLLLAAALLLVGSAAVRVARVLFDDTTTTATPWGTMSRRRARVLRVLVPVGVFILVVPLAAAAVFGRFHTPIEIVIIALVLGASLGLAPLVAAGGMGLAATWHGVLLNGDHITVGDKRGRVVRMNPFWVELEDENGLRRDVPMLSLINSTITHHLEPAPQRLVVKIKRPADIPAALESVHRLVKESCPKRTIECLGFDAEHAQLAIDVWAEPQQTADLVRRLADPQIEHPVLELTRVQYPDMVRSPA